MMFLKKEEFYCTSKETEFIDRDFGCKNISIDYAIMEKSDNVYVYPADFGWEDLGTWGSLYMHLDLDKNKNAVQGNNVLLYESADNIINVPNNKTVVMQGMNGYVVVAFFENEGTLLI